MRFPFKAMVSGAAALLVSAGLVLAANTTFFTNIGDQVFPFKAPTTNPAAPGTIDNMTIGATTPAAGNFTTITGGTTGTYVKNPPTTVTGGASYLFGNSVLTMLFEPAGTSTYAYVTLAAAPKDGQSACVFSTQTITALYVNANTNQSINNGVTTLAANAHACYLYSLANTTWDRSQ